MTNYRDAPLEVFVMKGEDRAIVGLTRPDPTGDAPPQALVGTIVVDDVLPRWSTVELRDSFIALYTEHMRGKKGPRPAIIDAAKVNPGDHVYVIDGRVQNPQGNVPVHDIIGWYKSEHRGRPVPDSFEYNEKHLPFANGRASSMLYDPNIRALVFKP